MLISTICIYKKCFYLNLVPVYILFILLHPAFQILNMHSGTSMPVEPQILECTLLFEIFMALKMSMLVM
jgi:hypothetical protein